MKRAQRSQTNNVHYRKDGGEIAPKLYMVTIVLLAILMIELAFIISIVGKKAEPVATETSTLMVSDKGTEGLFTVDGQKYVIVRGETYERN